MHAYIHRCISQSRRTPPPSPTAAAHDTRESQSEALSERHRPRSRPFPASASPHRPRGIARAPGPARRDSTGQPGWNAAPRVCPKGAEGHLPPMSSRACVQSIREFVATSSTPACMGWLYGWMHIGMHEWICLCLYVCLHLCICPCRLRHSVASSNNAQTTSTVINTNRMQAVVHTYIMNKGLS